MVNKTENNGLERGLGLKEAVALNMIEIVGIGPFVVSSLVIRAMGGPQALIAWLAGALLATLDAFVWSELGAAMPKAGCAYVFRFSQKDIRATCFRHCRAQLGPHKSIQRRQQRTRQPSDQSLRPAHRSNHQGTDHERSDPHDFDHVQRDGFFQSQPALQTGSFRLVSDCHGSAENNKCLARNLTQILSAKTISICNAP